MYTDVRTSTGRNVGSTQGKVERKFRWREYKFTTHMWYIYICIHVCVCVCVAV